MMCREYEIADQAITDNLGRICNQIFKLLPMREEGQDWQKPLETLIIELLGMSSLLSDQRELFSLVCKLEGLQQGEEEINFMLFRRTIFECCSLVDQVRKQCLKQL